MRYRYPLAGRRPRGAWTRIEIAFAQAAVPLLCLAATGAVGAPADRVQWAGQGRYRALVQVEPRPLAGRAADDGPARIAVDFPRALASLGAGGECDPATLQVIRYDPETGKPLAGSAFAAGRGRFDVPYRLDAEDPNPYWFLYNVQGDGQRGTLVWAHRQEGDRPSHYAIYFDTVRRGRRASRVRRGEIRLAARAWAGDGDGLFREEGDLPSFLHTRPVPFDWDADGRLDLVIGDLRGFVFFYRNVGTRRKPAFDRPLFLQADGKTLKVPWSAAPLVTDWDGDGLPDLLVSQEPDGLVHFYRNVGTRKAPKLVERGLLQADGKEIVLPHEPVPEAPGVFGRDYVGVPEVVDWNGDGRRDLILGGYVTGRIFLYEATGRNADGTPVLASRGPLEADGKAIDVSWAATPTVGDIDADGRLELISGSMYMTPTGGEAVPPGRPGLFLYRCVAGSLRRFPASPHRVGRGATVARREAETSGCTLGNAGTPNSPRLKEVPFPIEGKWVETYFLNPRLSDWNGDGLLDLVAGAGSTVVTFRNVGSRTRPRFRREGTLRIPWVPYQAHPDWAGDWDGDGRLDFVGALGGDTVRLARNTRVENPPRFDKVEEVRTESGKSMVQPPKHGDPWAAALPCDFDGDGDLDMVVGDVAGFVWRYENTGTRAHPRYADGARFTMADGKPLVVGIAPGTAITDFTALQGNRAVPACADFDRDGKTDLAVGDATGGVTLFRNVGDNRAPRFAPGQELLRGGGRMHVAAGDWDGDGAPDLVVADSGREAGQQVRVIRNTGGQGEMAFELPGRFFPLCWIPYPQPSLVDVNGDGDCDLLFSSSYGVVYFAERTFLEHGCAEGRLLRWEKKR